MGCYFMGSDKDWKSSTRTNLKEECRDANILLISLGFIPYWFRFWQCVRKYYDSKQKLNLVNAGKYFSDLMVPIAGLYFTTKGEINTAFWVYFWLHMWATTYSYIWDIYMDWGLMRCFKPGKMYLRPKINYKPSFYYWAMFSNFILRYLFIVGMFSYGPKTSLFNEFEILSFILSLAEGIRRAQWGLLRVENEMNNNLE
mmetsp:Transcript_1170/g.800  ORF Transcript_1170/g.800 Transcript_1170/m.800 type:complete len:199 (+) Transcript_1170:2388-2984(+)